MAAATTTGSRLVQLRLIGAANGAWNYGNGPQVSVSLQNVFGAPTDSTCSVSFISSHDGTSTTLALSENIEVSSYIVPGADEIAISKERQLSGGVASMHALGRFSAAEPRRCSTMHRRRMTGPRTTLHTQVWSRSFGAPPVARPNSNHPGGDCVMYCDGHTGFIADSIPYNIYATLMTCNGAFSMPPGQSTDTNSPTYAKYQIYPLDAGSIPSN